MTEGVEKRRRRKETKPKLTRRMEPFSRDELQLIRAWMRSTKASIRDRTLFETALDSMLRCGDLLRLEVGNVRAFNGSIRESFDLVMEKTGETVTVGLTDKARELLAQLIVEEGKYSDDFLFTPAARVHGDHLSEVMYRRIVKQWAAAAHLNPELYSGHSLRRTKAVFIYRETKDYEMVRQALGHTSSLSHTIKYLGIKSKDAARTARSFDL